MACVQGRRRTRPPSQLTSHDDKKKIAFFKHELHDTVAAYVLFAYGGELPPDEAVRTAIVVLDNSPFMGHTLRADTLGDVEEIRNARCPSADVLRGRCSNYEEGAKEKPKTWVTRVRIVRDKDTLLGKGIAYVQFADREYVDEILALEPGKLKFAKRRRTLTWRSRPAVLQYYHYYLHNASCGTHSQSTIHTPTAVPKGNPNLGMQLAHLSKAERKAAKAVDPERVARRLAKKKARNVLQVLEQRKDRVRVRKNTTEHKGVGAPARRKKSRVRSERSVEKRNTKK
ncbi:hypothetical protein EDB86DRAFT_3073975 [Lactarius hatsudake]|nr:hypothetical protein EDB86DRAFT_3073975 [Lactarius hatsudake]